MKVSKRDIGIIITVIGILVLIFTYNFVFNSYATKKDQINAEISTLSQTEMNLQTLADNRPQYEADIVDLTQKNEEIIEHFPADILPENEIMYGVELQENADIFFTDLDYGVSVAFCEDAAAVDTTAADTTETDTETTADAVTEVAEGTTTDTTTATVTTGNASTGIQANLLTMNMGFESSYQGLKDAILYTKEQNNRMIIDGVDAAFDPTTGQLSGTLTLNQYYITGTDKEYVEPYVPATHTGTDDIFGSYDAN